MPQRAGQLLPPTPERLAGQTSVIPAATEFKH